MNIYNVHLHLHKLENTFTQKIIQMPERACALELYDLQKDPGEKHNLLKVTFSPNCCFHAFRRSSQMPGAPWLPTSKPAWWKSFQRWQRQLTRTRFLLPPLCEMVHCPLGGAESDGSYSKLSRMRFLLFQIGTFFCRAKPETSLTSDQFSLATGHIWRPFRGLRNFSRNNNL